MFVVGVRLGVRGVVLVVCVGVGGVVLCRCVCVCDLLIFLRLLLPQSKDDKWAAAAQAAKPSKERAVSCT